MLTGSVKSRELVENAKKLVESWLNFQGTLQETLEDTTKDTEKTTFLA